MKRIERFGLRLAPDKDFEMINPERDDRYKEYWTEYYRLTQRRGVSRSLRADRDAPAPDADRRDGHPSRRRRRHAVRHVRHARAASRLHRPGDRAAARASSNYAAMNAVMLPTRTIFIADTYVNPDPNPDAARRDHAAGRRRDAPLRHRAQGRAAVAFELRLVDASAGEEDAGGAGADQRDGPRPRGRGRDARRRRARRGSAARRVPEFAPATARRTC